MMVLAIARRELRSLFLSPMAWAILAVVQLILAYLFLNRIDSFLLIEPRLVGVPGAPGVTGLVVAPLLGDAGTIVLLVMPLLTMHLISEERRSRTLNLLFSSPASMTEITLGKYLGILLFLLIMLAMIALMPLSLLSGTHLDLGMFGAGLLGLVLLAASFAAAGLFMSTLTSQPAVAAISTFGLLLLLWIIDWAGTVSTETRALFGYLSLTRHYETLLRGIFNSGDIVYYLLFIITFLVLSVRRLDAERLQH